MQFRNRMQCPRRLTKLHRDAVVIYKIYISITGIRAALHGLCIRQKLRTERSQATHFSVDIVDHKTEVRAPDVARTHCPAKPFRRVVLDQLDSAAISLQVHYPQMGAFEASHFFGKFATNRSVAQNLELEPVAVELQ